MDSTLGQCMNYRAGSRCPNPAAGCLYHPDGQPNPGGCYCIECAGSTVGEYLEKLGEAWFFTLGDYPPEVPSC